MLPIGRLGTLQDSAYARGYDHLFNHAKYQHKQSTRRYCGSELRSDARMLTNGTTAHCGDPQAKAVATEVISIAWLMPMISDYSDGPVSCFRDSQIVTLARGQPSKATKSDRWSSRRSCAYHMHESTITEGSPIGAYGSRPDEVGTCGVSFTDTETRQLMRLLGTTADGLLDGAGSNVSGKDPAASV